MMWGEEEDEYLAAMGYKVRPSDMTSVAEKLEQLLATTTQPDDAYHLSDTVHYNPADIDGWLNSMISELSSNDLINSNFSSSSTTTTTFSDSRTLFIEDNNISASPNQNQNQNQIQNQYQNNRIQQFENNFRDDSEYDIGAIPGIVAAAYNPPPNPQPLTISNINHNNIINNNNIVDDNNNNNNKRIKQDRSPLPPPSTRSISTSSSSSVVVVVVDSPQEAGIRLVHTLMACAEAVQNDNLTLADALVKQIGNLALSQAGAMRKVATYFAEALARRIYKIRPHPSLTLVDAYTSDVLQSHFYESCPYLKFAHFTANQAILESLAGAERVHVIDFSMKQGMQWPPLIQALARRAGGPPVFRLTGIGPPQPDNTDALREVGMKLAQFADMLGVRFHYRGFVCENLADLDDPKLQQPLLLLQRQEQEEESAKVEEEVVVVNSVFELHRVLSRPGDVERVMKSVRAMRPKIFTVVEQEANHNCPLFWERFNEALHYYSTMFDSLEGCNGNSNSRDLALSEVYLGRQICNVVACEGAERVERHETLVQWRARFQSEGFEPVHLGSDAFRQASMLLAYYGGGDGYKVEENNGCLMLGWHTRPLIATSAWRLP